MTGRVGMSSKMFSINEKMSRPKEKLNVNGCIRSDYNLGNKKPSGKHRGLGHTDWKISNNMKSVGLNATEARPKYWGKVWDTKYNYRRKKKKWVVKVYV